MGSSQTKLVSVKLYRLLLIWPTWLAERVRSFQNFVSQFYWLWGFFLVVFVLATGIWGPHLIVVRTCKLLSWEVEFKRWCPGLKILLYLGNKRERRSMRMVKICFIFTCALVLLVFSPTI